MRKLSLLLMAAIALIPVSASGSIFGAPDSTPPVPLGDITGWVELIPGVAATQCVVRLTGTPRGASCDSHGWFEIRALDPGRYDMVVTVTIPHTGETIQAPPLRVAAAAFAVTLLPPTVMARPVTIGGLITGVQPAPCGNLYVTVAAQGVASPVLPSGVFTLGGLPLGRHHLELRAFSGRALGDPRSRLAMDVDVHAGTLEMFNGLRAPSCTFDTVPEASEESPSAEPPAGGGNGGRHPVIRFQFGEGSPGRSPEDAPPPPNEPGNGRPVVSRPPGGLDRSPSVEPPVASGPGVMTRAAPKQGS